MRLKQLIASLIFIVFYSICVKAQIFDFNTLPLRNQQVPIFRNVNNNNNIARAQRQLSAQQQPPRQRQQQQNVRIPRQQTLFQQSHRPVQEFLTQISGPTNPNNIDTIVIIETEPVKPQRKQQQTQNSSRRPQTQTIQTQRQQQSPKPLQTQQNQRPKAQAQVQQTQRPKNQSQTQQPKRPKGQSQNHSTQKPKVQSQTQQTQRPQEQQTQPTLQNRRQQTNPSFQRPQQNQQEYYQQQQHQQNQYQRPTHEDAPFVFPGNVNNPHRPTEQNVGFVKPNNPFLNPTTTTFTTPQGNFNNPTINNGFNQFNTFGISQNPSSNNPNTFERPQNNFNNQQLPSQNFAFTNNDGPNYVGVSSTAFVNVDASNGLGVNTNSFANSFVGNNYNADPSRWYNPRSPDLNYYRNFAPIFNDIDRKAENDYNTSEEDNGMNDDFNGRSVVSPGQYPHMAALGYRTSSGETEFKCGGSLISEMYILTAAHCCFLNGQAPHLAKLGDINLKDFDRGIEPQQRGIARVIKHPYYNSSMHYHDIGLLELTNEIEFTYFVRPIRLWARDEIPYSKVFTMGYGSTSFAQAPTHVLTELDLQIIPLDTCNKTLPNDANAPYGIVSSQICAKDFEKNRDTCQGDSGGPLQLNLQRPRRHRLRYYLVGVISYGTFCRSQYPGVYTRVSSYIDWIASHVWPTYLNNFQY